MRYQSVDEFRAHVTRLKGGDEARRRRLLCCCGTGCLAGGAADVAAATQKALDALTGNERAELNLVMKKTGCHGFCEKGPLLVLMPEAIFYKYVQPKDVPEVIEKSLLGGQVVERLLYRDPKNSSLVTASTSVKRTRGDS